MSTKSCMSAEACIPTEALVECMTMDMVQLR
jgi:hypothetical protein